MMPEPSEEERAAVEAALAQAAAEALERVGPWRDEDDDP